MPLDLKRLEKFRNKGYALSYNFGSVSDYIWGQVDNLPIDKTQTDAVALSEAIIDGEWEADKVTLKDLFELASSMGVSLHLEFRSIQDMHVIGKADRYALDDYIPKTLDELIEEAK